MASSLVGACALLLLAVSAPARAELGGGEDSIEADRARMNASVRSTPLQHYTVHEISLPGGTAVREYLSPAGKVFAVAWRGPFMPDLKQLFGSYFAGYQESAGARQIRRGPLHVNRPELVVDSGGHMRSFSGVAYVPQLLPANVSVDEIR